MTSLFPRTALRSRAFRPSNLCVSSLRFMSQLVHPTSKENAKIHIPSNRNVARGVASSVSNKPASQSIPQAALNVKEESSNAVTDFAKMIAGTGGSGKGGFVSITRDIASDVPKPAMVLGLAGTLPYVGSGITTVYLARQAGLAVMDIAPSSIDPGVALTILDQALSLQVTYGAVMLSFLGAIHWGFEFAKFGGEKGYRRLLIGVVPVVWGWSTLAFTPMTSLVMQWLGFTGLWAVDARATSYGWAPKWYAQYRFYLSILVGTCIIGSLAGCSYYGPVAGHGFMSHDLDLVREERKKLKGKNKASLITGDVSAVAEENDGGFVHVKKREAEQNKKDN